MWTYVKSLAPFAKGLLGAILGGVLILLGVHFYTDHQAFHQVVGFINTHGAKIAALPDPGK